jgi:hypothetical protein
MLDLYRIPHRTRIAVCRLLLLGTGLCYGAVFAGAPRLVLYAGITCQMAWVFIPERETRPERKAARQ